MKHGDNDFQRFEVVCVLPGAENTIGERIDHLVGNEGAVIGMACGDLDWTTSYGMWSYQLDFGELGMAIIYEHHLESTGKFMKYEDFYSGASVRVTMDAHGRGDFADPDAARRTIFGEEDEECAPETSAHDDDSPQDSDAAWDTGADDPDRTGD